MNTRVAATMCAALFGSAAHADIVYFINPAPGQPGHYAWTAGLPGSPGVWLDITRPSHQQFNVQGGNAAGQVLEELWGITYSWHQPVSAAPIASLLRSSASGFSADPLSHGSPLGPSSWWHTWALHIEVEWYPYSVNSLFPEGQRRYLGVRTDDGRYGWIEVERTGVNLTAYSWAYETVPGVPILAGQIPTPGAAVLLSLASITVSRRRRT
ncbi:MAG: hypothetical protein KF864_00050 [Phycisphaeraceae bacterium]|nr:hypothetical protein [Phycisphaeraceae bacterium]